MGRNFYRAMEVDPTWILGIWYRIVIVKLERVNFEICVKFLTIDWFNK